MTVPSRGDEALPFLKPDVVPAEAYTPLLAQMDESGVYTNYGPMNAELERRLLDEQFGGVGHLCTVANATLGLILALATVRSAATTHVVMPSFTFAATPHAALWNGLTPYFVDIDADRWQADPVAVEEAVSELGEERVVVMPYATFGAPLELAPYARLQGRGVSLVVDAAASLGARPEHEGQAWPMVSGPVVFSMHATKSFPVGEGGVVWSTRESTIEELRRRGNFGFDQERSAALLGLNSKLTETMAAVGLATLDRTSERTARRRGVREAYADALRDRELLGAGWRMQAGSDASAPQFMSLLVPDGRSRDGVAERLARGGISSRTYFSPACHQQALFADCPRGALTVTEDVAARVISLPLWPDMSPAQVECVVEGLAPA